MAWTHALVLGTWAVVENDLKSCSHGLVANLARPACHGQTVFDATNGAFLGVDGRRGGASVDMLGALVFFGY